MYFARYTRSPLIIIPPILHIHFPLHVALTRMAYERSPGTFQKQCCSGYRGAFRGDNHHKIKILWHWGCSSLHSSSVYFVEVNGQLQSSASLSLRKHPPSLLYVRIGYWMRQRANPDTVEKWEIRLCHQYDPTHLRLQWTSRRGQQTRGCPPDWCSAWGN